VLRIGLTGGIASGKSAVADMFAELGAALVDTDRIAREIVEPGQPALDAIRSTFGESVFSADGSLDRSAMRALVFSDERQRQELEALLHPLIRARTLDALNQATGPYVIVAVPLLVETDFATIVDRVLVVHCTIEQQIARVMQRDNIDRDQAMAILAAQIDEQTRLRAADDILDNTGSLTAARQQVQRLHEQYVEMAHNYQMAPRLAE